MENKNGTEKRRQEIRISHSRCFLICCVGDSFVWNINIHVPLSVSASGEPDVIDVRNGSCLSSVL